MPNEDEQQAPVGMTEPDEDLGDPEALLKALRREREARKNLERQLRESEDKASFTELRSRFPFVEVDDFEGLPRDKWESRAERLAQLRASAEAAEQTPQQEEVAEVPEAPDLARVAELGGTPADETPAMTRADLDAAVKAGKLSPAQGVELIRTGKVSLEHQTVRQQTPFG